jgi:NAD kinase
MDPLTETKIILIKRKSRLDELIARFNSIPQAKFYIEHLGADFSDYQREHDSYASAILQAADSLQGLGRVQLLDRMYLPNFLFGRDDLVVAVGPDGLVANTLKYLDGQRLLGVNPDPQRWDGVLLPFKAADLGRVAAETLAGRRKCREVSMAAARLNNGQSLLAVNDLFIGQRSHVSARYRVEYGGAGEVQSSSGLIVSTGLGSTGWLRSILAGADGVVRALGGSGSERAALQLNERFEWNADYLYFSVREPFPSRATGAEIVFGKITSDRPLRIVSQMAESGVIFSDGIESDYLEFNSGAAATITLAEKHGLLVV